MGLLRNMGAGFDVELSLWAMYVVIFYSQPILFLGMCVLKRNCIWRIGFAYSIAALFVITMYMKVGVVVWLNYFYKPEVMG